MYIRFNEESTFGVRVSNLTQNEIQTHNNNNNNWITDSATIRQMSKHIQDGTGDERRINGKWRQNEVKHKATHQMKMKEQKNRSVDSERTSVSNRTIAKWDLKEESIRSGNINGKWFAHDTRCRCRLLWNLNFSSLFALLLLFNSKLS